MSSERETCGLGSIIPMSCRGRAEAFARRLQSRLQTLGRSGPGLDESADESSWIGRQSSVTSCQPRLSSSSDSDIFFDFDLDTSGSPEEELPPSSTTSTHQLSHDIDSGSALSFSTTERTSPVSEGSSDERYFDPECSDCESSRSEASVECKHKHKSSVSSNGSKKSNCATLCNGHIGYSDTENPNLRSKDDCYLNSTLDTERYNKINTTKIEQSNMDDLKPKQETVNCCIPNTREECTEKRSNADWENARLVFDSVVTEMVCTVSEDNNETDNLSQNTSTPENAFPVKLERKYNIADDSVVSTDVGNALCNCRLSSDEVPRENYTIICEETNQDLALLNEYSNLSQNNHEQKPSLHCCSTFNRPKNLLIDCATLSSDIEQISTLVPVRIDNNDNASEETAETVCGADIDTESRKPTVDEVCDDDDDDDEDERPRRIRRSSSLKSGKTPPGTPGRKKIVRFADVLGLDLADVRTFLDEVPWVPQSAYQDLQDVDLSESAGTSSQNSVQEGTGLCARRADKCLVPMFQQPGNQPEFLDKVRERQVCLESALVTDTIFFTISGIVRVRNLDFHKSVYVRYTLDGWKTFSDLQASYIDGSCDGFSDKFSFKLYAHTVSIGCKVEFAIRFQCRGVQYWDSNLGANYTFQCLPPIAPCVTSLPLASPLDDTWATSFY